MHIEAVCQFELLYRIWVQAGSAQPHVIILGEACPAHLVGAVAYMAFARQYALNRSLVFPFAFSHMDLQASLCLEYETTPRVWALKFTDFGGFGVSGGRDAVLSSAVQRLRLRKFHLHVGVQPRALLVMD